MECFCGQPAVYFRRHEGTYLCKECLSEAVEKSFLRTIRDDGLVSRGEKIVVGVSGGKDSLVMLHLFHKFQQLLAVDLAVITINEGIDGYRNKSIEKVASLTKKLGIAHYEFSFSKELDFLMDSLPVENKHCTFCGVFRRYLLNKKSRELKADKLAIGHNLDDESQSVFMNVIRGDADKFMRMGTLPAAKNENLVQRIKPLRNIPEREITAYAVVNEIDFHDAECPYSHDNVRRDVQKIINDLEEKRPGTKLQIVNFCDKISKISRRDVEKVNNCSLCSEPSGGSVCKACELLGKVE